MPKIFFLFFQEYFSFRNSTFACDEYFAVRTQIRGQTLQAVKQSLTWMPKTFDARFPVSVNSLWWAMCSHLSRALSKFKCLAAKHLCLNPLWYYFLVTCPRLDPNDGITGRGCAWMSLEVDSCRFNTICCWLFIYWYSEDLNREFPSSPNRFLRRTPTSQDHFALRQLLWPPFCT